MVISICFVLETIVSVVFRKQLSFKLNITTRLLAQLKERLLTMREVPGSNPIAIGNIALFENKICSTVTRPIDFSIQVGSLFLMVTAVSYCHICKNYHDFDQKS